MKPLSIFAAIVFYFFSYFLIPNISYSIPVSSETSLGYSIDTKPGLKGKPYLGGSFLTFGVALNVHDYFELGLQTIADGGKSREMENYRLSVLPTLVIKLPTVFTSLSLSAGKFSESGKIRLSDAHEKVPYSSKGSMYSLILKKEFFKTKTFSFSVNTLLGIYRADSQKLEQTSDSLWLQEPYDVNNINFTDGTSRGISIGTNFWF